MTPVDLILTQEIFEKLWALTESRRKHAKVDIGDLMHVLMDYATMLKALRAAGVKVIEPPRRKRPHLGAGEPLRD